MPICLWVSAGRSHRRRDCRRAGVLERLVDLHGYPVDLRGCHCSARCSLRLRLGHSTEVQALEEVLPSRPQLPGALSDAASDRIVIE